MFLYEKQQTSMTRLMISVWIGQLPLIPIPRFQKNARLNQHLFARLIVIQRTENFTMEEKSIGTI